MNSFFSQLIFQHFLSAVSYDSENHIITGIIVWIVSMEELPEAATNSVYLHLAAARIKELQHLDNELSMLRFSDTFKNFC